MSELLVAAGLTPVRRRRACAASRSDTESHAKRIARKVGCLTKPSYRVDFASFSGIFEGVRT